MTSLIYNNCIRVQGPIPRTYNYNLQLQENCTITNTVHRNRVAQTFTSIFAIVKYNYREILQLQESCIIQLQDTRIVLRKHLQAPVNTITGIVIVIAIN